MFQIIFKKTGFIFALLALALLLLFTPAIEGTQLYNGLIAGKEFFLVGMACLLLLIIGFTLFFSVLKKENTTIRLSAVDILPSLFIVWLNHESQKTNKAKAMAQKVLGMQAKTESIAEKEIKHKMKEILSASDTAYINTQNNFITP